MISFVAMFSIAASILLWLSSQCAASAIVPSTKKGDYVVLLHGMGRTSISMKPVELFLAQRGYQVVNVTYRSRQHSVEELSENFLNSLLANRIVDPTRRVHFVTHSLGGIIVRQYLSKHTIENLGRVVMLAPPNHGSEIIDLLRAHLLTRHFLGVAARELSTEGLPVKLGPVHFECGIIAGDRSLNALLSCVLSGPNDGKVTIASASIPGMKDFLTVHGTHTWLMCQPAVLNQTLSFLQSGHFSRHN